MSEEKASIAEMKTYIDSDGRRVIEFVEMIGKDKGKSTFKGQGMIMARSQDPRMQPQQLPFDFPFPEGHTLKNCFKDFDKYAQEKVDAIQKQQQEKSRLIHAKSMPTMLGPNGRPIGK